MGLFKRTRKGGKVVWGISFQWQKEQQQELVGSKVEAQRRLAQRRREVTEGTYSPEHKTGAVTAAMYAKTWGEKRTNKTARDDRTRLTKHFVPYLGEMKIEDVRPRHIIEWVKQLRAAETLSPKAILNVYGTVRTMFKYAVIEELIAATPCVLPENVLPAKPDKEPGIYEKPAVVKLITDARVPWDRRVFYTLAFLTGMRHGELAGRRWRDWDRESEPLGALQVRTQYKDQPLKSPDGKLRPRVVPVHWLLEQALLAWRDEGFPRFFGRKARPDDYIVPSRRGTEHHRTVRKSLERIVDDCERIGVPPLTFHRSRDTFISLCRRAGAPKDLVERITHNSSGQVIDRYTHIDWAPLCAAVMVVQLPMPSPPGLSLPGSEGAALSMSPSMSAQEGELILTAVELETERGGRDSNTPPSPRTNGNSRERRGRAPRRASAKSPEDPEPSPNHVTGHDSDGDDFEVALREHSGAQPPPRVALPGTLATTDDEVADAG